MTPLVPPAVRVLAIDPSSRGFGFAVLEDSVRLVDWGIKTARPVANSQNLRQARVLMALYQPHMLALEDCSAKRSRRCPRVRALIEDLARDATRHGILVRRVSPAALRRSFSPEPVTKHRIAALLANRFPELAPQLPPIRKPWMSEDPRMAIFDAVALALAASPSHDTPPSST